MNVDTARNALFLMLIVGALIAGFSSSVLAKEKKTGVKAFTLPKSTSSGKIVGCMTYEEYRILSESLKNASPKPSPTPLPSPSPK